MGIENAQLLHTAESMFHDQLPRRAHGLDYAWIYHRYPKQGFKTTMDRGTLAEKTLRFDAMAEMDRRTKTAASDRDGVIGPWRRTHDRWREGCWPPGVAPNARSRHQGRAEPRGERFQ
jgi:hypothetical protein